MVFHCCVLSCPDRKGPSAKHRFPRDQKLAIEWLQKIGRLDLMKKGLQQIRTNYRVCDMHFSPEHTFPAVRNSTNLKRTAVPDQELPAEAPVLEAFNIEESVKMELHQTIDDDEPEYYKCILCKNETEFLTRMKTLYHSFPANETIKQQWLKFCGLSNESFRPNLKICSLHFTYNDYDIHNNKRTLKNNSLPTVTVSQLKEEYNRVHSIYNCLNQICRVCLCSTNLKTVEYLDDQLGNLIQNENIHRDKMPQHICAICLKQLELVNSFIGKVKTSTDYLHEIIDSVERKPSVEKQREDNEKLDTKFSPIDETDKTTVNEEKLVNTKQKRSRKEFYICRAEDFLEGRINPVRKITRPAGKCCSCKKCGRSFPFQSFLKQHMIRQHQVQKRKPKPATNGHLCYICGKTVSDLCRHLDTHSKEEYVCHYCGERKTSKTRLNAHITSVHKARKLICEYCSKSYNRRSQFERHLETHQYRIKHVCDTCGKIYNTRNGLKDHLNVHTGEKPFRCKICGAAFSVRSSYFVHAKWHKIGEEGPPSKAYCKQRKRPSDDVENRGVRFECGICGKDFKQKLNCIRHVNSHTDEENTNELVPKIESLEVYS